MAGMGLFVLLKSMVQRMIESLTYADVGAAPAVHDHDDRYYTEEEVDRIVQDIVVGDLPDRSIPKSKLEKAVQDTLDAADAHIAATEDAHPASAISYAGSANLQATNVEEALDELDAEKAGKAQQNIFTQHQVFAEGIQDGISSEYVSFICSVQHQIHTRSTVLTYSGGRLTKVEEKHGSTVVKTTTLNYDDNGRLSSMVETAGGITKTSTLNYDANGNLTSVTRT